MFPNRATNRAILPVLWRTPVPDLIAKQVGLSARQFGRLFNDHIGMTPKKFILETRLRYARWLIENSRRPITTIAYDTGFADGAHLATAFKARYGKPPTECRRHLGLSAAIKDTAASGA